MVVCYNFPIFYTLFSRLVVFYLACLSHSPSILLFAIVYMKNEFVFGPNIHVCLRAYKQSSERLLGYGWCEHFVVERIFQIHFVLLCWRFFCCCCFFSLLVERYVNNSDVVQVTILKNVVRIWHFMGKKYWNCVYSYMDGRMELLQKKLLSTTIIHLQL